MVVVATSGVRNLARPRSEHLADGVYPLNIECHMIPLTCVRGELSVREPERSSIVCAIPLLAGGWVLIKSPQGR